MKILKKIIFIAFSLIYFLQLSAMSNDEDHETRQAPESEYYSKFGVKIQPYGYLKLDTYFDSRQNFGYDDNVTLLFPEPKKLDPNGEDINAKPQFNMTSFLTTLGLNLTGPEFCNVKISGKLESYFYGLGLPNLVLLNSPNELENLLTFTSAYTKFDFLRPNNSLLLGYYLHPLFNQNCYPETVSNNYGEPIECYEVNPQIRFIQNIGDKEGTFELALLSQDNVYNNDGPIGFSNSYLKNSAVPDIAVKLEANIQKHLIGAVMDFKRLVPRLETDKGYKAHEHINSFIGEIYAALNLEKSFIKIKVIYAQNANDQSLISGYGVRTINPITDHRTYSNTNCISAWIDMKYQLCKCENKEILLGLFIGGTKNLGSMHDLYIDPKTNQPIIYTFNQNLDHVLRVSPRFTYQYKAIKTGVELETTSAAYGKNNKKGQVVDKSSVTNFRILGSLFYYF